MWLPTWLLFSWKLLGLWQIALNLTPSTIFSKKVSAEEKSHGPVFDSGKLGALIFSDVCVVNTFTQYQVVKYFEDLNSNAGRRNGNGKGHSCMSSSM